MAGSPLTIFTRLTARRRGYGSWVHVRTRNVALNRPLTPPAAERLVEIPVAMLMIQGEADI